jgi:hypothetical protein
VLELVCSKTLRLLLRASFLGASAHKDNRSSRDAVGDLLVVAGVVVAGAELQN